MLEYYRINNNLTVTQMAKKLGVPRQTYWCWETKRRKPCFKNKLRIMFFYITHFLGFF